MSLWIRPASARSSVCELLPGEGTAFSSSQGIERIKTKQLLSVSALKRAQADDDLHTQLREGIIEALVVCRWGYYTKWKVHNIMLTLWKDNLHLNGSNQYHYRTFLKWQRRVREKKKRLDKRMHCDSKKVSPISELLVWYSPSVKDIEILYIKSQW